MSVRVMKSKVKVCIALMLALAVGQSALAAQNQRTNRSMNVRGFDGTPASCADLQITFDRRPAITEESQMTLTAAQVSTLRAQTTNGGIYVQGWDRNEYSVKTCKAVPDDSNGAATLREIRTENNGGQLKITGPSSGEWMASLIINVPRLSNMDLDAVNGPLSMRDMAGVIRVTATNGPLSLSNIGGSVQTTATNGPISLSGISGDQKVTATNGPVNVALSGNRWEGPGLEVSARNGPMTVSMPESYGSGVQIQTNDRSPVNCKLAACSGLTRTPGVSNTIRLGSGDTVVRLSTQNGPLSIQAAKD